MLKPPPLLQEVASALVLCGDYARARAFSIYNTLAHKKRPELPQFTASPFTV